MCCETISVSSFLVAGWHCRAAHLAALYSEDPVNRPVLKFGSSGEAVTTVQEVLTISQHYRGEIDGEFSTQTEEAVRAFQKSFGIEVDGIVDRETWTALSKITRGYDPNWFLT
jgi:peptidoglycan hydrolase-like protein with peptidoglycan-binding domain